MLPCLHSVLNLPIISGVKRTQQQRSENYILNRKRVVINKYSCCHKYVINKLVSLTPRRAQVRHYVRVGLSGFPDSL